MAISAKPTSGQSLRQAESYSPKSPEPYRSAYNTCSMWDVFISHASEDKETIARPLAVELEANGLQVWLDSQELYVGDQLTPKIEQGLQNAQFGVVIFSRNFFAKKWTQFELESLLKMEKPPNEVILPVLHGLTTAEVEVAWRAIAPPVSRMR